MFILKRLYLNSYLILNFGKNSRCIYFNMSSILYHNLFMSISTGNLGIVLDKKLVTECFDEVQNRSSVKLHKKINHTLIQLCIVSIIFLDGCEFDTILVQGYPKTFH